MTTDMLTTLVDHGLKHNGGTLDTRTGEIVEFESGYIVGGVVPSLVRPVDDTRLVHDALDFTVKANAEHVGIWLNDGHAYVDVVEHVENLQHALALARMRGELAIWDCANSCEVLTSN